MYRTDYIVLNLNSQMSGKNAEWNKIHKFEFFNWLCHLIQIVCSVLNQTKNLIAVV